MEKLYNTLKEKQFIIAGPCVIESEELIMDIAKKCKKLCDERNLFYIFKASFDKANRTSAASYRGTGMQKGLELLEKVKKEFNIPVTTDIHESYQAEPVAQTADILQIPAFLARQTDLLIAAAKTGRIVNIKKAQFMSGADMLYPLEKVRSCGNNKVMLTERGSMFGYNNLVVDFRNLIDMAEFNVPVIMDVTHSTQKPGGLSGKSGGDRRYAPYIAYASAAVGVRGHFFEVHPDPDNALSDGPNMVKLEDFPQILDKLLYHSKN